MRKRQVEVIKVVRRDTMLEFRAVGTSVSTLIHPNMEDGVRLHLIAEHKARKAAEKARR